MKILIGAPVRQDEETFQLYLASLKNLNTKGLKVEWFFILHNSPNLKKYLEPYQYTEVTSNDEYKKDFTHHWTPTNLSHVAMMKNELLKKAKQKGADYFFLVDSDILLHPDTLQQLVKSNKKIISEIFWTRWHPEEEEQPNAWIYDHYSFDTLDRFKQWREKGLYQVGMTGACILIHKDVFTKVNYSPIYNVSYSAWEDRAFCIRAAVHVFEIWMDTHYPAKHLYRKEDLNEVLRAK
jgi:hypothetical protein